MKKSILSLLCMMMFFWFVPGLSVQAEEAWQYEYEILNIRQDSSGNIKKSTYSKSIKINYPVYGFYHKFTQGINVGVEIRYASVVPPDVGKDEQIQEVSGTQVNEWASGAVTTSPWNSNVPFITADSWINILSSSNVDSGSAQFQPYDDFTVTFPLFADEASLVSYLKLGDESGWVNKPDVDYSVKHDFSKDVYDPNIPVPELSNLSYNGFSISNREDYYIDVIVDYSLLGVKTYKKAFNTYRMDVDEDWVFSSHYYNFTLDNRAVSQDVVDINNIYGVDIEHDLIEDFKSWSAQYPDYKKLPTYSFFARDINFHTIYDTYHVYSESSADSDLKQLQDSSQGLIFYYVRFYNENGDCGQWIRYSFRTSGGFEGSDMDSFGNIKQNITTDLITVGTVKSDSSGKPLVDNEIKGNQDKNTGEIGFKSSEYIGLDITDVNSYFSYIRTIFNNVSSSLDSFGSLITACFGFLPQEVVGLLIFGIVLMVFVGIVKAVIS